MSKQPVFSQLAQLLNQKKVILSLSILLIATIYFLLHGRYILHHVDDAWFGTRIYHYFHTGVNMDTIFKAVEVTDRTQIFYVFFNNLYGSLLEFFGWTKSNAHLICTFFIAASSFIWYHIAKQLKFSENVALLLGLTMMVFPAFFKAANHARPDAMAFCIASLAFFIFLKRYYYLAGLVLMMAFESHVMGLTMGFYIAAYVVTNWKEFYADKKKFVTMLAWFGAGLLSGLLYYYLLHKDVLTIDRMTNLLVGHRSMGTKQFFKNVFTAYFVQARWYLHVWEFFLIVTSFYLFIKHKIYKQFPFLKIVLIALLISTFILSRPNRNYIIYFFPAIMLMSYYSFEYLNKFNRLVKVLAVLIILQYTFVYSNHRTFDLNKVMAQTEETISDKSLPVVGIPDNWWPAREHSFHQIYRSLEIFPKEKLDTFYLIRNDYKYSATISNSLEKWLTSAGILKEGIIGKRSGFYNDHIEYFEKNCTCEEINRFRGIKDQNVVIYKCVTKKKE